MPWTSLLTIAYTALIREVARIQRLEVGIWIVIARGLILAPLHLDVHFTLKQTFTVESMDILQTRILIALWEHLVVEAARNVSSGCDLHHEDFQRFILRQSIAIRGQKVPRCTNDRVALQRSRSLIYEER